ncbi:MAG: hypothetical protein Q4B68_02295 [Bacteroidales bacterium]|nr:hypothetical protein [Bacteroidales bacterium]
MNISILLKEYFEDAQNVSIDVFDEHNLNDVYQQVINVLTSHIEIELSVLQALSYCFYEILDNVHIHSGKPLGSAITYYNPSANSLRVLVADDGMGIKKSLSSNDAYASLSEGESLKAVLKDAVTDGKGMGFGLYATSRLVENIGINFVLHSGAHKLVYKGGVVTVEPSDYWQGTIVFLEVRTKEDFDPNDIVAHRTDVKSEYNEFFIETDDLETLW